MRNGWLRSLCVLLTMMGAAACAQAQGNVEIEVAFPNLSFNRPVDLQHAGDGSGRLFVVEQAGRIRAFPNHPEAANTTLFLDIADRVHDQGNEEGLLGLAFHPDFPQNGRFFVYYTAANPRRSVLARFQRDPLEPQRADPASETRLLEVAQPFSNHNGGQLAFGPDGLLYVALGDGGSGGDPLGHGQNRRTLLGSILRLDVDRASAGRAYGIPADNPFAGNTEGFREELYAYGLRNPWRMSFDVETGRLWAADVGQNAFEEIDVVEAGGNYGWRTMEGASCFDPPSGCDEAGLRLPVWSYDRGEGRSVTGGYVYRGPGVPSLVGWYVYGDFVSGKIWALAFEDGAVQAHAELLDTTLGISSFGVDENRELYFCAFDGRIYRFTSAAGTRTGEADVPETPSRLRPGHPNPFRAATTVAYSLARAAPAELAVFDAWGRRVRTLARGVHPPGEYAARWDGRDDQGMPSAGGVYFFLLSVAGAPVASRPVVRLR